MTHDGPSAVSPWLRRFADHVPAGGRGLDLACGAGRPIRLFSEQGCRVLAVQRIAARREGAAGPGAMPD